MVKKPLPKLGSIDTSFVLGTYMGTSLIQSNLSAHTTYGSAIDFGYAEFEGVHVYMFGLDKGTMCEPVITFVSSEDHTAILPEHHEMRTWK